MTCATLVARRQCHVEIRDVRARPVVSPRGVPPVDRRPRYRLFTPVITAGFVVAEALWCRREFEKDVPRHVSAGRARVLG